MKRKLALALMLVLVLLMLVPFEALAQEIVDDTATAVGTPMWRTSFYAHNLYWEFYNNAGVGLSWRTSADGTTWSAPTSASMPTYTQFDLAFDGTYIHCAVLYQSYYWYAQYRGGNPNADGTITWTTAWYNMISVTVGYAVMTVSISVDSNGYPYFTDSDNGDSWHSSLRVWKSTTTGGLFTKDYTYGTEILSTSHSPNPSDIRQWTRLIALSGGKMAALYYTDHGSGGAIKCKRWTGSGWGSESTSTLTVATGGSFSAVAQDDDVHIVGLENSSNDISYMTYSYSTNSFSAETTIYGNATSTSIPSMSMDNANNLHVFWENDPVDDHMYYAKYAYDESTWVSYYDLIDEIDDLPATGYYLNTDYTCDESRVGVYYIADTTILKFKLLDEPFVVDTLAPNPLGNTYATLRGEIISLGFGSATEHGFLFNTSPTDIGAILEGNETGTFNKGVFTHGKAGLLAAHTYWYVAYASGDYGTSWGNWTSFYTTSPPAPTPPAGNITGDTATICSTTAWNFLAVPVSNTDIKLTWDWWPVSGNSSTQIAIYYGLYYYPIDLADGTLIYQGTGDAYTHTNLSPGTTYYYRAWLLCGGNYSADYVQDWATTYGSSPVVSPPEQPEGWFQDPNCIAYSKIPLLSDALIAVTTAYGFPATTVCVMFTLLWIIVLGLAVFLFIHSAMMMIITIAVLIILTSIMGLLPLWMIVIAICLGGISIYISGRT